MLSEEQLQSAREAAVRSAREQGLPDRITDRQVLERVVALARGLPVAPAVDTPEEKAA